MEIAKEHAVADVQAAAVLAVERVSTDALERAGPLQLATNLPWKRFRMHS